MKRFLALATVVALSGSLLVACGGSNATDTNSGAATNTDTEVVTEATSDEVADEEATEEATDGEDVVGELDDAEDAVALAMTDEEGNLYNFTDTGIVVTDAAGNTLAELTAGEEEGVLTDAEGNAYNIAVDAEGGATLTNPDGEATVLTVVQ